ANAVTVPAFGPSVPDGSLSEPTTSSAAPSPSVSNTATPRPWSWPDAWPGMSSSAGALPSLGTDRTAPASVPYTSERPASAIASGSPSEPRSGTNATAWPRYDEASSPATETHGTSADASRPSSTRSTPRNSTAVPTPSAAGPS